MTQSEVASAMGVSQPNYQRWESGAALIPKLKQKKLAKILKISVEELIGEAKPFDYLGLRLAFEVQHHVLGIIPDSDF